METSFSIERFIEKVIPKQIKDINKIEIGKELRIERNIVSRIDVKIDNLFYIVLYVIQTTKKENLIVYINRVIEDISINISQSKKPVMLILLLPPNIELPDNLREWFINAIKKDLLIIYPIVIPMIENVEIFKNISKFIEFLYSFLKEKKLEFEDEYLIVKNYRKLLLTKYLLFLKTNGDILEKYGLFSIKDRWSKPWKWFEEILKAFFVDKFFPDKILNVSIKQELLDKDTGGQCRPDFIYVDYKNEENELWIWIVDTKHWKSDFCKKLGSKKEPYEKYYRYYGEGIYWKEKILEKLKQKNINIRIGLLFITKEKPKSNCKEKLQILEKIYEKAKIISLEEAVNLLV